MKNNEEKSLVAENAPVQDADKKDSGSKDNGPVVNMDDVATKIVEILKKHMKEPRDDINESTALADLQIESLDLAMIVFDIEDSFGFEIPYNANEESTEDFQTVGSVVERVKSLMAESGKDAASARA